MSTLLLESHALTSGTTWHTAGMLWRLRPSYVDIELNTYTRQLAIDLDESTGQTSWTQNGGLVKHTRMALSHAGVVCGYS